MKSNNIVIAHPSSKHELGVIKAFFNALNIDFEEATESGYNPKFVTKIKKAQQSKHRTEIDPNNVWESLGLH